MNTTLSRRQFFTGAIALGAGLHGLFGRSSLSRGFSSVPKARPPVAVTLWFPQVSQAVGAKLMEGASALDAIEYGINLIERDRSEGSVGAGANTNLDGVIELDAAVMSGPDHNAGSVAALQNIATPISVARKVMEHTPHELLVGAGALKFARSQGFEEEDLRAGPTTTPSPASNPSPPSHDTVGVIVLDENLDLWVGMSTSGTSGKMPGRVGDSPIIGAGSYVDNDVGGAIATGVGEQVIKFAGSYQVVENMRQGMSPAEACNEVLNRMLRKGHTKQVAFTALNKAGEFGAVSMGPAGDIVFFPYYVFADGVSRRFIADAVSPIPERR